MASTSQQTYTGPVKLVVVDMAGTVTDYGSRAPAGAFVELFRRNRVPVSEPQARAPMGMAKKDHIRAMAQDPDVAARWRRAHGRDCTEADVEAMYAQFVPLQIEALPEYCDLIPGVLEAMDAFRAGGLKIAATTGYNSEMMHAVLDAVKAQGFEPDTAVCASDVPGGRPAPWMIFECMRRLDVYPPQSVVKIGDTIPDIQAARNAGAWAIGVTRTGNMLGLSVHEDHAMQDRDRSALLEKAHAAMSGAGAHFVAEGIAQCPHIVERIGILLAGGQQP